MKNPPFFITGLPRSRTAWLANFLTTGTAFCQHEISKQVRGLLNLSVHLKINPDYSHFGTSDSGLLLYDPWQFFKVFPNSPIFLIRRFQGDSFYSLEKALGKEVTAPQWISICSQAIKWERAMMETGRRIYNFEELDEEKTCADILTKCLPGLEFDYLRWEMLQLFKVEIIKEKWRADMSAEDRAAFDAMPEKHWDTVLKDG